MSNFFLKFSNISQTLLVSLKDILKCKNLVTTEHFLPFSFNDTFQYIPRGNCKIRLQGETSLFRVICFAWNWTCSMLCNNTIFFSMQIACNDEIHALYQMIPKMLSNCHGIDKPPHSRTSNTTARALYFPATIINRFQTHLLNKPQVLIPK